MAAEGVVTFNPYATLAAFGVAAITQKGKGSSEQRAFARDIAAAEQRNPEKARELAAATAEQIGALSVSKSFRAIGGQKNKIFAEAAAQARGITASAGAVPDPGPAPVPPGAVFGFVDTGRPLPPILRPDPVPTKIPKVLTGMAGRILWPVAVLEMGKAIIKALEKRGKIKTEREAADIFERDEAEMRRIRVEADKRRLAVIRAGQIILPKGPQTRTKIETRPELEPARPRIKPEVKPGTAPAVPRPQRAPKRAVPAREPAPPARTQPKRPPARPKLKPSQRVGRILRQASDLGRVLDLIGRPTRRRSSSPTVGRIELPPQPTGPTTSLVERTARLERLTRTKVDKCVCDAPKRKPGICRQGYFKETPNRTTYIEWSRRDCVTPKFN